MIENAVVREATQQLAAALRDSEEDRQDKVLKDTIMENETNQALLKEFQRTQTRLQMAAVSGHDAEAEDVQKFQQLSSLLYMNAELAQYLMAQMRLQQMAGEVFQQIWNAAELEFPGM